MRGKRTEGRDAAAMAPMGAGETQRSSSLDAARRASVRLLARLPRPVRLAWIFLAILGAYSVTFNLQGLGLLPLIVLPAVAAEVDALLQVYRFHSVRVPDAAIATGLFLALLLPPTVSLIQAGVVTVAAIVIRSALRYRERPLFNPAVVGVLIGALLFGMAPSWWGAISMPLVVALGIVLTLRSPGSWRMPLSALGSYAVLSVLGNVVFGKATSPQVLLLGAADPAILFFGLFMVPEPRTAPTEPSDRLLFGLFVGISTALLPVLLPSLAPLVALLLGNVMAVSVRGFQAAEAAARERARAARRGKKAARPRRERRAPSVDAWNDWSMGQRVTAGVLIVVLLGAVGFALNPPTATPFAAIRPSLSPGASVGNVTASCAADNPSIPASTLSSLHQRLGPSVILSADQNSGTVVFYDPVNHVTVTETDMYEDFGFAEFNGDDYAVSGCAP